MSRFQTTGGWAQQPSCPCDTHLVEYFAERRLAGKTLFHMGSGLHHTVGFALSADGRDNEVIGITASRDEHSAYVDAVIARPEIGRRYTVLFGDLYTLSPRMLPVLDVVSLFHLCEPPASERADIVLEAVSVVRGFLTRLRSDGLLLFYDGSSGREPTRAALGVVRAQGLVEPAFEFKSLVAYRPRGTGAGAAP